MPSLIAEGGFTLEIPSFPSRFGTAKSNHIRVRQGMGVAEHQFTISLQDGKPTLQDAGSGIPTMVNGSVATTVELRSGDKIQTGKLSMTFSTAEVAKPTPPPRTPKPMAAPMTPPASAKTTEPREKSVAPVATQSSQPMKLPDILVKAAALRGETIVEDPQLSHFSGLEEAPKRPTPLSSDTKATTAGMAVPSVVAGPASTSTVTPSLPASPGPAASGAFQRRLLRPYEDDDDAAPRRSLLPWKQLAIAALVVAGTAGAWAGWKGVPVFEMLQGRMGLAKKPPHTNYLAQIANDNPAFLLQIDLADAFAKYNSYAPDVGLPTILEVQKHLSPVVPASLNLSSADRLVISTHIRDGKPGMVCLLTFKDYLNSSQVVNDLRKGAKATPKTIAGRQVHPSFLFSREDVRFTVLDDKTVLVGDAHGIDTILPVILGSKPASPAAKDILKDIGENASMIGLYANLKALDTRSFTNAVGPGLLEAFRTGMGAKDGKSSMDAVAAQFTMNDVIQFVTKTCHSTPAAAAEFAADRKRRDQESLTQLRALPGMDQKLVAQIENFSRQTGYLVDGKAVTMSVRFNKLEFAEFAQTIGRNAAGFMQAARAMAGEPLPRGNKRFD